jgi:hypothetical protein
MVRPVQGTRHPQAHEHTEILRRAIANRRRTVVTTRRKREMSGDSLRRYRQPLDTRPAALLEHLHLLGVER